MPSTDWRSIEGPLINTEAIVTVVSGIETVVDVAKEILELTELAISLGDVTTQSALETSLDVVSESLTTAMAAFALEGGVHVLVIPAAEYTYEGMLETVSTTLNELRDLNRPVLDANSFIAGALLLITDTAYDKIVQSGAQLVRLVRSPNPVVSAIKTQINGEPHYNLRTPQNLSAVAYMYKGKLAVRLLWDPERRLSTRTLSLGENAAEIDIESVVILRSTEPFREQTYTPTAYANLVSANMAFPGLDKPLTYSDTTVEEGVTYYYAVGYKLRLANGDILDPVLISNVARVVASVRPDTPLVYKKLSWISVNGGLSALYPDLDEVFDYITRFIDGYISGLSLTSSEVANVMNDFVQAETSRLGAISQQLDSLISRLEIVSAPFSASSIGSFAFQTSGAAQALVSAISDKLLDTTDEKRPSLTNAYALGLLVVVTSETAAAAITAYNALSSLLTGEAPVPSSGLDAALASIQKASEALDSEIEYVFGPDLQLIAASLVAQAETPPTLLELP